MGRELKQASSCDSIWDSLSVYADGEASPGEAADVELHIASCADCARDLAFMRGAGEALAQSPEVAPPFHLRESILAATVYKPRWYQRLGIGAPALRWALAGAATAAVAYVLLPRPVPSAPAMVALGPATQVAPPSHRAPAPTPRTEDPATVPIPEPAPELKLNAPAASQPLGPPLVEAPKPELAMVKMPVATLPKPKKMVPAVFVPVKRPVSKVKSAPGTASASTPDKPKAEPAPPAEGGSSAPSMSPMDTMAKGPMMADNMLQPMPPKPDPMPTPATPGPNRIKITLTSSSEPMSAGAVASLADIRKTVRVPTDQPFASPGIFRANDRREVNVDIYKTRF